MVKKGLKFSFIGAGKMAKILIKTLIENDIISPDDIIATRRTKEELNKLENEFSIHTTTNNKEAVIKGDIIILAVNPQDIFGVLDEISPVDSSYLFSWDDVSKGDVEKLLHFPELRRYLMDYLDIDWTEKAEICKSDDGKAIRIFKDQKSAEVILNDTEATLKINGDITLKVKKENGKLNIYVSKLLISIATGVTIQDIQSQLNEEAHVIRAMPNTSLRVREGVIAISKGKNASNEDVDRVKEIFTAMGNVVLLKEGEEKLMDAISGLSGSGPAYIYLIIEALSDAGVKMGLPRETSLNLAAQTVLGAAKMVLETGKHPAELKDEITTPGGTTIAGLHVLEECAVRSALIKAVEEAVRRSSQLVGGDKE